MLSENFNISYSNIGLITKISVVHCDIYLNNWDYIPISIVTIPGFRIFVCISLPFSIAEIEIKVGMNIRIYVEHKNNIVI